jgi:hypothetical protein
MGETSLPICLNWWNICKSSTSYFLEAIMASPFNVMRVGKDILPEAEQAGRALFEASGIMPGLDAMALKGEKALDRLFRIEREAGVPPLAARIQAGELRIAEAQSRMDAGGLRAQQSLARAESIRNGSDPRWVGVPLSDDARLQGHPGFKDTNGDKVVTSQDGRLVRTSTDGITTFDFGEHLAGHRQTTFGKHFNVGGISADGTKVDYPLGGISITEHPLGDRITSHERGVLSEKADGRATMLMHGKYELTEFPNGSFDFTRADGMGASLKVNDRNLVLRTFGPGEKPISHDTMPRWALDNLSMPGAAPTRDLETPIRIAIQRREALDRAV